MRLILGVVFAFGIVGCAADTNPLTPTSAPHAGVPTSLTLALDRQSIPHNDMGGAVMASVVIAVQPGTNPAGVPVQFVMTMDNGAVTSDIGATNAEGRVSRQFNFSRPGTIAVSSGGFSESAVVTRQAPPPPANSPPPNIPSPSPPPTAPTTISVMAVPSTYSPRAGEPFTITVTATMSDGSAATGLVFDFDSNGDNQVDFRSQSATNSPYTTPSFAYATTGTRTFFVRVSRENAPHIQGNASFIMTVQ